ncbi:MAG TPA: hypothetical protein DCX49_01610 [Flavobacteriales bacterium]|nr:hypothetical protein [Flavobacteriales bacterium]
MRQIVTKTLLIAWLFALGQAMAAQVEIVPSPSLSTYCAGDVINLEPLVSTFDPSTAAFEWNLDGLSTTQAITGPLDELVGLNGLQLAAPGTYEVTLSVTEGAITETDALTIVVTPLGNAELSMLNAGSNYEETTYDGTTTFAYCGGLVLAQFDFSLTLLGGADPSTTSVNVDWGDGTSESTTDATAPTLFSHEFSPGQYALVVSTETSAGCVVSTTYAVFVGVAPIIQVTSSASNLCLTGTHELVVSGNGTVIDYEVYYTDDIDAVESFTSDTDVMVQHTFASTSCGEEYPIGPGLVIEDAYSAIVIASNACTVNGFPSVTTFGPIQVSEGPEPALEPSVNGAICPGVEVAFTNVTETPELVTSEGCTEDYAFFWELDAGLVLLNGTLGGNSGAVGADFNPDLWLMGSDEINVTANAPGMYAVTLHTGTNCGEASVSYELEVLPGGNILLDLSSQALCSGEATQEFTFEAVPSSYEVSWQVLDDGFNPLSDGDLPGLTPTSGVSLGSATVPSWTLTNTGDAPLILYVQADVPCPTSAPATHQIVINQEPIITAMPEAPVVCSGEPLNIQLSTNTGNPIVWPPPIEGPGISGSAGPDHTTEIVDVWHNDSPTPSTVTYTITDKYMDCPGDPTVIEVTVLPGVPTVKILNMNLCPEDAVAEINFPVVEGIVWTWSNDNDGVGLGSSGADMLPSWSAASNDGTGPIESEVSIVGQVGSCNPIEAGTFNISISPEPTIVATPQTSTICSGETTDIALSVNTGETIIWEYTQGPFVSGANGDGHDVVINHTLTNVGTFADLATYTLNVKNPVCPGQPTVVEVEVLPEVPNQALSGGQACDGEAIAGQEFDSWEGLVWTWANNNTDVGLGASGEGGLPSWTATNGGTTTQSATVVLTGQVASCPEVVVATAQFDIHPLPQAETIVEPDGRLSCLDGEADVSINFVTSGTSAPSFAGPSVLSFDGSLAVVDMEGAYLLTLESVFGCTAEQTVDVLGPDLINIVNSEAANPLCHQGATGAIAVQTDEEVGVVYEWSPSVSTDAIALGLEAGEYALTVTNPAQCQDSASWTLVDPEALMLSLVDSLISECGEDNGYIEVLAEGGTPPLFYLWDDGNSGPLNDGIDEGDHDLSVVDANGCLLDTTFYLPCLELVPPDPNRFLSPNGDGSNETWKIKNILYYKEATIHVYNRWGIEVYSADPPYENTWDGRNADGTPLPSATYFYLIDTQKKSQDPFRGFLEIQSSRPQ